MEEFSFSVDCYFNCNNSVKFVYAQESDNRRMIHTDILKQINSQQAVCFLPV